MKLVLFISLAASLVKMQAQSYYEAKNFIAYYEGVIHYPKNDHIGIGHHEIGLENRYYDDNEIDRLFASDLQVALTDAHALFPNYDKQPDKVKLVLLSLSYNLGLTRLARFVKFRNAIEHNNYAKAANELRESKWFTDVKRRGPAHCADLESCTK